MNSELLTSKTVWASVVLLLLSGVRVGLGDVTAVQGVQDGLSALIPIFLRAAIGRTATDTADAAAQGAAVGAREGVKDATESGDGSRVAAPDAGGA